MMVMPMRRRWNFMAMAFRFALRLTIAMGLCFSFYTHTCVAAVVDREALLQTAIYAMAVKSDFRSGVEFAQRAVQMYPDEAHPHEWLAYGLAGLGRLDEALEHYRTAAKLRGGSPRLNAAWLPLHINSEVLKLLGIRPVEVSAPANDKRCAAMFIPIPCFTPLLNWRAPEFLDRYNQMLVVYRRIDEGNWKAALRIHFKTPSLTRGSVDWTKDASLLALSLSMTMCCSCSRIGALPVEVQPLNVWISDEGEPVAVSKSGHIFWRGVKPGRGLANWFIEAAHEYGHHAFPPFGPFEGGHERYSGGMVSERLNAIWLLEMLTDGSLNLPEDVDVEQLKAQLQSYVETHFTNDMLNWFALLSSTMEGKRLRQMDMSSFLGMIEFAERLYSAELLGAAMRQSEGEDVKFLLKAIDAQVRKAMASGMGFDTRCAFVLSDDGDVSSVLIAPLHKLSFSQPCRIAIPVWLPEGSFECELLVDGVDVKAAVSIDGIPNAVAVQPNGQMHCLRFRVTIGGAWWHLLSIEFVGHGSISLKRLLVRELK